MVRERLIQKNYEKTAHLYLCEVFSVTLTYEGGWTQDPKKKKNGFGPFETLK